MTACVCTQIDFREITPTLVFTLVLNCLLIVVTSGSTSVTLWSGDYVRVFHVVRT